jgi:hypothetical protein
MLGLCGFILYLAAVIDYIFVKTDDLELCWQENYLMIKCAFVYTNISGEFNGINKKCCVKECTHKRFTGNPCQR